MKRVLIFLFIILAFGLYSQEWQPIKYAPPWFGPNANPVPEFTQAFIPKTTQLSINNDVYFGYGDLTISQQIVAEVPLIPSYVSVKFWGTPWEYFNVTPGLATKRIMPNREGFASGDYYVQTRVKICDEKKRKFNLVVNGSIKTASSSSVENKRYFNTAGYFFDTEISTTFRLEKKIVQALKLGINLGFMSWDVGTNLQDDAAMYGVKSTFLFSNAELNFTFAGYWGWMHTHPNYGADYGDAPMIVSTNFIRDFTRLKWTIQYQYGLINFPYHQIRTGFVFNFEKLTPRFKVDS